MSGSIDKCPFELKMSEFFRLIASDASEADALIQQAKIVLKGLEKHAGNERAKNAFQTLLGEFFLRLTNLELERRAQQHLQVPLQVIFEDPPRPEPIFEWGDLDSAEKEIINADL